MITSVILAVGILLALVPVVRPAAGFTPSGRITGFIVLFLVPMMCAALGFTQHIENTHKTEFCTSSCHVMELHGRSLKVDDDTLLAATHYLSGAVPKDRACYACHTTYTMYGDVNDKYRGFQHVWHNMTKKDLDETKLKLYTPYNNRECLHCHEGTRRFEKGKQHRIEAGSMAKIRNNEKSCVTKDCHEFVHDVASVKDATLWKAPDDAHDQPDPAQAAAPPAAADTKKEATP